MIKRHGAGNAPSPSQTTQPGVLTDRQGRRITYVRLAITDRCNLRCRYCRSESGVPFIPHDEILSLEECERLVRIFSSLGVSKVRVTGGEPFSRRGCLPFLSRLRRLEGVRSLHITTNGVKTAQFLDELRDIGIDGLNLSLDTLDPHRFWTITRRNFLDSVLQTLHGALARDIPVKVNSVVLEDTSDAEMVKLAGLARDYPITLRFIERMPFSGTVRAGMIDNGDLVGRLRDIFPGLEEYAETSPSTARLFSLPGYAGRLGVIQGHSRRFCATCNKVRITPPGRLKTCLYDNGVLDLRMLLRQGAGDQEIAAAIAACVGHRFADGREAEHACRRSAEPSMSRIGG
ncbi:MAG: GTP 3',8-cyclase MoaA [Desulfobulbaceae bacterium]|nr:GTP 3',8-cyclase MoaA [Desulfobulbaceae bacterium]MDY0351382.1 GTP 3',8-cyclase MoaA [Desulfobulbaceae bacterium]